MLKQLLTYDDFKEVAHSCGYWVREFHTGTRKYLVQIAGNINQGNSAMVRRFSTDNLLFLRRGLKNWFKILEDKKGFYVTVDKVKLYL